MSLSRRALWQELSWLGLFAALVIGAMAVGVDAAPALLAGLAGYAAWHLVQSVAFLRFAEERGYPVSSDGYISKCHLCLDIRKHLSARDEFEELAPKELYAHLD